MNLRLSSAALVAALYVTAAWPQAAAPAGHEAHHGGKPAAAVKPAAKAPAPAAAPAAPAAGTPGYESAFADYRPFKADEPLKDWRRANDEVREAGGHAGLVKGGAKK